MQKRKQVRNPGKTQAGKGTYHQIIHQPTPEVSPTNACHIMTELKKEKQVKEGYPKNEKSPESHLSPLPEQGEIRWNPDGIRVGNQQGTNQREQENSLLKGG